MRIRYLSYLALAIAAGFLVVATYAYTLPTVADLALGVGIVMLGVSLVVAWGHLRDGATVAISGAIAAVSAFMIVASQAFSLVDVDNLTFALALVIGGLAVVGLTVNELVTERVVHRLEVHQGRAERTERQGAIAA